MSDNAPDNSPADSPNIEPFDAPEINHVLFVGSGWVGRQVAAQMAAYRVHVTLYDRDESVALEARQWCLDHTARVVGDQIWPEECLIELADRVRVVSDLAKLSAAPDMILESVPEQVGLKRRILQNLSQQFPSPIILCSNSSYFYPSVFTKYIQDPRRFAHYHFHVPVWRATIADIMGSELTANSTIQRLKELSVRIGQTPIVANREHPGYVVNWMLQALINAALQLVARGVVSPSEVDKAWRGVTGMHAGPFTIMDHIGLDIVQQVLQNGRWSSAPNDQAALEALLEQYVQQGKLGVKSEAGFYDYDLNRPTDDNSPPPQRLW